MTSDIIQSERTRIGWHPITLGLVLVLALSLIRAGGLMAMRRLWGPSPARAEGDAFPGFSRAECDAFGGDSVAHRLTWRGSPDVSSLRGRVVRLR